MYGTLAIAPRSIRDLAPVVGEEELAELDRLARPLRGLRILNLSITAFGTGVAELLNATVPLMTDLGLDCQWQVVRTAEEFTPVNRSMYMALGGRQVTWSREMADVWQRYNAMNADLLTKDFDVVVVHDPQPAGIRSFVDERRRTAARWVMHCHLDISSAQENVWLLLRQHIEPYDAIIFEMQSFAPSDVQAHGIEIIRPAIDPAGPRNMDLSPESVAAIAERYGIDAARPLLCQLSPLDESCDPMGAIDVYDLAREAVPDLQLLLVATVVPEEPLARASFDEVARKAMDYTGVSVLSGLNEVGNVEMNAFQRAASVILQKDLRRGFGLWVSDALWKERPVVAAPRTGLLEQVIDGQTGFLAESTEEFSRQVVALLQDRSLAARLGAGGRRHVRENLLITRYLSDYLRLLGRLTGTSGKVGR
jgi:trehalose synthase